MTRSRSFAWRSLIAASILIVLGERLVRADGSKSVDLGVGPGSSACAINRSGVVVGNTDTQASAKTHAFVWTEARGFVDVGTLGGSFSFACAINDGGTVAGYSATPGNAAVHLFVWDATRGIVDIGSLLESGPSTASAVNNDGMVVGTSGSHAFAWTETTGFIDIGTLDGGCCSSAHAVNAHGMVVGESAIASAGSHAFSWTQATGMIDLGTLGGTQSAALAVNDAGVVVGRSTMAGDVESHAFAWTASGGMVDLGSLGGRSSQAVAINNAGMVIGSSTTADPANSGVFDTHAFAWTSATSLVDLGTLGGHTSAATAIDDLGVVVGYSTIAGDAGTRAFVWTQATGMADPDPGNSANSTALAVSNVGVLAGESNDRATAWRFTVATTAPIAWPTPSGIVYGTALGAAQLNATSDIAGTFTYSPPEGTVLQAGDGQTLSVIFTPTDLTAYRTTTVTVPIDVAKATPQITWARPAAIAYGTSLDATQLDAVANVPGSFFYSPQAGTILPIGAGRPLSALFMPADAANYATAIASVAIDVTSTGPPAQPPFQVMHSFTFSDGAASLASLVQGADNSLYGTTSQGGIGYGTVFRMDAAGTITTLHAFNFADGAYPSAPLLYASDGFFYGTTVSGGQSMVGPVPIGGGGTIFRIDAGGTFTTLHVFSFSDGTSPRGGLIQAADGFFYGTTVQGGSGNAGTVYRMDASGNLTTLHAFGFADGAFPYAGLIQARDGWYYGTTQYGMNGAGTVFRIDASGSFTTLHTFSYFDGANPFSALMQASDGVFYGTTASGGPNGAGTIYQMDASGNVTVLHAFANIDGATPYAGLIQTSDGFFYGVTNSGGARFAGTVFRMDAAGAVTTVHTFTSADGGGPYGGLVQSRDGFLYGTTQYGGPQGGGTVYRVTLRAVPPLVGSSQLVVPPVTGIFGGSVSLFASLTSAGVPLTGRVVRFTLNGQPVGDARVDGNGFVSLFTSLAGLNAGTYPGAVVASFDGDGSYLASSGSGDLTVARRTPDILWAFPAPIVHGTALDGTQLNATTDVPGAFTYVPPAGAILPVGLQQGLSVTFTPVDLTNYTVAFARRTIDVTSATDTRLTLAGLHDFAGVDGATPYASVIQARDGFFYGTTAYGGPGGYGTIYRIDSAGALTTLHAFSAADGAYPYARLLQAADGFFYGTTAFGGAYGYGTVFRMDDAGALTQLHAFTYTDGASPYAGLIQSGDGLFYGTTSEGGATGYGTVFRMDASGLVTTLHTFANADGAYPYGEIMQARDGFFYGTTLQGGVGSYGTVFRMDAAGGVTTLRALTWSDGAYPYSALREGSDAGLYGTTSYGGFAGLGTVFRLDPFGAVSWVHSFSAVEGAYPYATLTQGRDGFFYSTTSGGGSSGRGTVYRIDAGGTLVTQHAFNWSDGATPYGAIVEGADGFLYGTTQEGGAHSVGTVFSLSLRTSTQLFFVLSPVTGTYGGTTTVSATLMSAMVPVAGRSVSFTLNGSAVGTATTNAAGLASIADVSLSGLNPGTYPGAATATFAGDEVYAPSTASADLIVQRLTPLVTWPAPSSIVYGTALDGTQLNATANKSGRFFYSPEAGAILPVGSRQTLSVQFVPDDSTFYQSVIAYVLIDVLPAGPPTSATFQSLHSFTSSDGAYPYARLIQGSDGSFYGTTIQGSAAFGTVYRMDAAGSVTTLHAFNGSDGAYPYASLVQANDGSFYGTTYVGGFGFGTVYRIDTAGTFSTVHAFNSGDGAYPISAVIQARDGLLYGTTVGGGAGGAGTIFRLEPATNVLTTLHSFSFSDGAFPYGGLMQASDGLLYGTTYSGGPGGSGTVYRIDLAGALTVLHGFAYTDGANPYLGTLFQASDGLLYGTTSSGGGFGLGVAYRIDRTGNNFTTLHSFNSVDGAFPYGALMQASDGLFYGTTYTGASGFGSVYRLDGGGTVTTLHSFTYADGANPFAGLIQAADGKLYGTTTSGGLGFGTVFRLGFVPATQLSVSAAGVFGSPVSLSATLTAGGVPLAGRQITFMFNAVFMFTAVTDSSGTATVSGVNGGFFSAGSSSRVVFASFAGDDTYGATSAVGDLVVAKATPIITWPSPAPIRFGTPLDGTQLNATTNIFGLFTYDPPPGSILPAGAGQKLSVTFVPFDTANYNSAFATVTIDVVDQVDVDFGTFSVGVVTIPLTIPGGNGTEVWSVGDPAAGLLPRGISLRTDGESWFPPNASAGLIGVATTPGTYHFTLRVTSAGITSDKRATIRITPLLVSDQYSLPDAFVGAPYSYTLSAAGNAAAVTWTPTGTLPPGLTLDSNGVLAGTPAAAGFYNIEFRISDGLDTVFRSVGLFVSAIQITSPGALPNAAEFTPYTFTLTASGGTGSFTFTANGLPPGLMLDPNGTISGTPNFGSGKWGFNVTATDTNFTSYSKSMSIDVVSDPPTLAKLVPYGQQLDDCTIGVACTLGIGIYNGGTAPFTWTATGLPPGLWIRSGDGVTQSWVTPGDAQIGGAPTATGTFAVEVTATDALGATTTSIFPLHVSALLETDFPPFGTVDVPYAATLRVIGGSTPYTVALADGYLPAGVSFDPSTLRVTGTPIENGGFRVAWQFADASGETLLATRYPFIDVGAANITVNNGRDLGSAMLGSFFFFQLSACCLPAFAWSIADGTIPPGLTLSPDGVLSGTPTAAGRYTFVVRAADPENPANAGRRQVTLLVTPLFQTTEFTLPSGNVNTPYSVTLTAGGAAGPFTWTLARTNYLPPGLRLEPDGTLHGTPTGSGQYFFQVHVVDAVGDELSEFFTVSIYPEGVTPAVRITSGPFYCCPGLGQVDFSLNATGGNGAFTWEVISGSLPPGVSLRSDVPSWFPPNTSAGISGVATVPGTYTFRLRATSGSQHADQDATVRVSGIVLTDLYSLPDGFVGTSYSYALSAMNDAGPVSWSPFAPLPAGLTLSSDGVLSGTPTTAGFYNIGVRLESGSDAVFMGIGLNVYDVDITTPGVLPNATQNASYFATLTAIGGTGPYTFSAGGLPFGLTLDPSGTISGTTNSRPGRYNFTATATDADNHSYNKPMSIVVVGVPPALPAIGASLDNCTFATRCERSIYVFSGGTAPFSWTVTGLPPGMTLRVGDTASPWVWPGDAEIAGAPTALGTYQLQVTVTDAERHSATNTFPLHVSPLLLTTFPPNGTLDTAYSAPLRVIGGPSQTVSRSGAGLYDVSLVDGSLPRGIALDAAGPRIAGTPGENGGFSQQLRFSDPAGDLLQVRTFLFVDAPVTIFNNSDLGTVLVGGQYFNQLFACCPSSLTWSIVDGTRPPGIDLSPGGLLSGTPTATGTFTFLVQASDPATAFTTFGRRQFTLTVTNLSITTAPTLPFGNVGSPYAVTLTTTGAVGPVTWAIAPFSYLPPGLSLGADGTLSGTPTASGAYFFQATVTDSAGQLNQQQFNVSIYPTGEFPPLVPGFFGRFGPVGLGPVFIQLSASGGRPPYRYSLTPGAAAIAGMRLQDGAPLPIFFPSNVTAGFIGVITAPGTYDASIRITDAAGSFVDQPITIVVSSLTILSQSQLPKATVNAPYSFTFTPFGGSGVYTWSAAGLPPGVSGTSTGEIAGTPTISGSFFVRVTLRDSTSGESMGFGFTLVVDPFAIDTQGVLPQATVGTPYNQTLSAAGCGSPCTWSVVGQFPPPGVSLSATGVLSGTPSTPSNGFFTVQARGPNGAVQNVFSLLVGASTPQPLSIVNLASVVSQFGYQGVGGSPGIPLTALGGTAPYVWSLESGSLPDGVRLLADGEPRSPFFAPGFTYLSGRPQRAGTFTFALRVTDAAGASATRTFTWYITPLNFQYFNLPIGGNPLVYNTPYVQPLLVVGGTNTYTWSALTPMVTGLVLDAATGVVSGTPTDTGNSFVTIQATDSAGDTIVAFNVNFSVAGPTATPISFGLGSNLPVVQQGFGATFNLFPSGGSPPYTITAVTPLPPGFALESGASILSNGNPANSYFLAGNPLASGSFSFTLKAQDTAGNIGVRTFRLNVAPFTLFTSAALPDASVGADYTQSVLAFASGIAVTWTATSPLPPGLALSGNTISGTPTSAGTYSFTAAATDSSGVGVNFGFTLRVSTIAIADPQVLPETAVYGVPFSYTFTASGGGDVTWSAVGLPAGFTMSSSGTLSGTLALGGVGGAGLFTVTAIDGVSTVSRRFTVLARAPNPASLSIQTLPALADVSVGQSTVITLNASGGVPPYAWSVGADMPLPPGLRLIAPSAALGVPLPSNVSPGFTLLAGMPSTLGPYAFELIVTDAAGSQARRTFSLNVSALVILSGTPRTATAGVAYAQQFTAAGGAAPYSFAISRLSLTQDALPPGFAMSSSGLLSGTTTSTGSYAFTLTATDANGDTFSRNYNVTVVNAAGLFVTNVNPADNWVGRGRQFLTLTTNGTSTYSWSLVDGGLPPGVSLIAGETLGVANATFLGGPPSAPGTYTFTLRATDRANAANVADHAFTYRVAPLQVVSPPLGLPGLASLDLPVGQAGTPYSAAIEVAGGTAPYTFVESPFSPLPQGLALSADGVLSGTPVSSGVYTIVPIITDAAGFTLNSPPLTLIVAAAGTPAPLLALPGGRIPDASVGSPFAFDLDVLLRAGAPPFTWAVAAGSELAPGLSLVAGPNGTIDHLAGVATLAGFYLSSLVVTDSAGQTLTMPFSQNVSPIALEPDALPAGTVGVPYSVSLIPSGATAPYAMQLSATSDLPPGLTWDSSGVLSGTPNAAGFFTVTVFVSDDAGNFLTRIYKVTIGT